MEVTSSFCVGGFDKRVTKTAPPIFVIPQGGLGSPAYPNDAGLIRASPRMRHEQQRPDRTSATPSDA